MNKTKLISVMKVLWKLQKINLKTFKEMKIDIKNNKMSADKRWPHVMDVLDVMSLKQSEAQKDNAYTCADTPIAGHCFKRSTSDEIISYGTLTLTLNTKH